jgi:hypothetical protein
MSQKRAHAPSNEEVPNMHRRVIWSLILLCVALASAGCGSNTKDSKATPAKQKTLDGILTVSGSTATIEQADGTTKEFAVAKSTTTPAAELKALEAADEPVRATYAGVTLVKAESIADIVNDLPAETGKIKAVTDTSVDLDVDGDVIHFVIDPDDLSAMAPDHLEEHQAEHEDTVIHYEMDGETRHAKGFADLE